MNNCMHGPGKHGTFSIAASDVERGYWGVAVSTKPPAVGAVVPWAEWKVGAIATQATSNIRYGPLGLALLRKGLSAETVIARLTRSDPERDVRQVGVVDGKGRAAAWTGRKCHETAVHVLGDGYTCQGNIVASERVIRSMARAYERGRGSMASRLIGALRAGAAAGGDRRGMESAAIVVAHREPWFDEAWGDHYVDLRVDQHRQPVRELGRLVRLEEAAMRKYLRSSDARARRRRAGRP